MSLLCLKFKLVLPRRIYRWLNVSLFLELMGQAGSFKKRMHRIFTPSQAGAYSYDAQTVFPSISAECWGSLLYGVSPDQHGLDNDRAIHGQIPESFPYASLFKLARQQWPDAPLSAFSWEPINTGIIENTINVHMESKPDPELTEAIVDYIHERRFQTDVHSVGSPDGAGHKYGFGTDKRCYRLPLRIST